MLQMAVNIKVINEIEKETTFDMGQLSYGLSDLNHDKSVHTIIDNITSTC